MEKEELVKRAKRLFLKKGTCSEAVFSVILEYLGMDKELVRLATGFGAGIGRRQVVCGAISGAVLGISARFGRTDPSDKESKERAYKKCLELYERFEKEFSTGTCYKLIGCDLRSSEGQKSYDEKKLARERCVKFVEFATRESLKILEE
jgi:C_GCAxxG_C_C family probable redox protein